MEVAGRAVERAAEGGTVAGVEEPAGWEGLAATAAEREVSVGWEVMAGGVVATVEASAASVAYEG